MRFLPFASTAVLCAVAAPALAVAPVAGAGVQSFTGSGFADQFAQRDQLRPEVANLPAPVSGAVPEPATWAMLMAGFGLVGFAARRRRTAPA